MGRGLFNNTKGGDGHCRRGNLDTDIENQISLKVILVLVYYFMVHI